jgi:uncharacterized protein YxeA
MRSAILLIPRRLDKGGRICYSFKTIPIGEGGEIKMKKILTFVLAVVFAMTFGAAFAEDKPGGEVHKAEKMEKAEKPEKAEKAGETHKKGEKAETHKHKQKGKKKKTEAEKAEKTEHPAEAPAAPAAK